MPFTYSGTSSARDRVCACGCGTKLGRMVVCPEAWKRVDVVTRLLITKPRATDEQRRAGVRTALEIARKIKAEREEKLLAETPNQEEPTCFKNRRKICMKNSGDRTEELGGCTITEDSPERFNETCEQYRARMGAIMLMDCRLGVIGDRDILTFEGEKLYSEHGCGCSHLRAAWEIIMWDRPQAKWKTALLLVTLRQALRECYVQMMRLDTPVQGASLAKIREFLTVARVLDAAHHGHATF